MAIPQEPIHISLYTKLLDCFSLDSQIPKNKETLLFAFKILNILVRDLVLNKDIEHDIHFLVDSTEKASEILSSSELNIWDESFLISFREKLREDLAKAYDLISKAIRDKSDDLKEYLCKLDPVDKKDFIEFLVRNRGSDLIKVIGENEQDLKFLPIVQERERILKPDKSLRILFIFSSIEEGWYRFFRVLHSYIDEFHK